MTAWSKFCMLTCMDRLVFRIMLLGFAVAVALATVGALVSSPNALSRSRAESGDGTIAFVRFTESVGAPQVFVVRPGGGVASRLRLSLPAADQPSWARDGSVLIVVGSRQLPSGARITEADDLYLVRSSGKVLRRLTSDAAHESGVAWAPDGKRVVFVRSPAAAPNQSSLYLRVVASGTKSKRLTYGSADLQPSWSGDGRWIVFLRLESKTRSSGLWLVRPDGSGLHRVLRSLTNVTDPVWAPHGDRLVVTDGRRLLVVGVNGSRPHVVARLSADVQGSRVDPEPDWSPDGSKIVFVQMRPQMTGRSDLWSVSSEGGSLRRITHSPGIDHSPSWGS